MKEKNPNIKDNILPKNNSFHDTKIVSAIINPNSIYIMAGIVIVLIAISYAFA